MSQCNGGARKLFTSFTTYGSQVRDISWTRGDCIDQSKARFRGLLLRKVTGTTIKVDRCTYHIQCLSLGMSKIGKVNYLAVFEDLGYYVTGTLFIFTNAIT